MSPIWMSVQRIEGYDRIIMRWWWFIALIAALMILLALWKSLTLLIAWFKRPRSNPRRLFSQLVRIHKLNKKEKILLNALRKKLPDAHQHALIFVEPTVWPWANIEEDGRANLAALFQKIFGFPPDGIRV